MVNSRTIFSIVTKGVFVLLFVLCSTISSFASDSSRLVKCKGKLDNKYAITMVIVIKDHNIKGFYYYDKYKKKIPLTGEYYHGACSLIESRYDDGDLKTGFTGVLSGSDFGGIWIDIDNGVQYTSWLNVLDDKTVSSDISDLLDLTM